jgi:hypothetical protein
MGLNIRRRVKFPADSVHTLATNDNYTVEKDQEVKTQ